MTMTTTRRRRRDDDDDVGGVGSILASDRIDPGIDRMGVWSPGGVREGPGRGPGVLGGVWRGPGGVWRGPGGGGLGGGPGVVLGVVLEGPGMPGCQDPRCQDPRARGSEGPRIRGPGMPKGGFR